MFYMFYSDLENLAAVRKVPETHHIAPRNVVFRDAVVQRAVVAPLQATTAREAPRTPPSQEGNEAKVDAEVARGQGPTELDEPSTATYEALHISHSTPSMAFAASTWVYTRTPVGHVVITKTQRYTPAQLCATIKAAEQQAAQARAQLDEPVPDLLRGATVAIGTVIQRSADTVLIVVPRGVSVGLLIVGLLSVAGRMGAVINNPLPVLMMLVVFFFWRTRLLRALKRRVEVLKRRVDRLDPDLNRKVQMLVDNRDEAAAASARPGMRWRHTVAYLDLEECQSEAGTFEYLLILERTEVPETAEFEEGLRQRIERQLATEAQLPEHSVPGNHMSLWMRGRRWWGGERHQDVIEAQTAAMNEVYDMISLHAGGDFEP